MQCLQLFVRFLDVGNVRQRFVNRERKQLRQAERVVFDFAGRFGHRGRFGCFGLAAGGAGFCFLGRCFGRGFRCGLLNATNTIRRSAITRPATIGAGNVNIGKELHVERYLACSIASGATQASRVVRKITQLETCFLCCFSMCVGTTQVVKHAAVRCHSRAHVDANGRCIDKVRAMNAFRIDCRHVLGECFAGDCCFKCGNERFQHKGRFARTGNARYCDKTSFGNVKGKRLYRVQSA